MMSEGKAVGEPEPNQAGKKSITLGRSPNSQNEAHHHHHHHQQRTAKALWKLFWSGTGFID
jgi:hypothetical protein